MLKMEIIKFEAQDVITSSIPAKDCYCVDNICYGHWSGDTFYGTHPAHSETCSDCNLMKNTPKDPPC